MRVLSQHNSDNITMADLSKQTLGMNTNAQVDKSRKPVASGMKKRVPGELKTFGVPLQELVQRAPQGYRVPYAVKKICTYIEHHGLEQEGIFRINGSQRVVDKMKASFDRHGDANLDEDNDVMAVAGLLKLFLRELPESVIPEHMTRQFVNIQEQYQRNSKECVPQIKEALKELPEEHHDLLKHMIRFLAIVSCNEPINKMSPMALAIVFGPNLFRCGKGFLALKDQGTTNQIVYRFIVDYNSLFKDPKEDPPAVYWSKIKNLEGGHSHNHDHLEDHDHSESSISSRGRNSYNSPSFSDDEMTGRLSPFHLDSDSGFSLVESPVPSARTSEFVDKAIKATVIGRLFGDESSLLNASIDTTLHEDHSDTVADSTEIGAAMVEDLNSTPTEENAGVRDRVRMFEMSDQDQPSLNKPAKSRPTSKAFDMFEKKGIIITQLHGVTPPEPADTGQEDPPTPGQGFDGVGQDADTLHTFKRPAGPQNRRSPSRRIRGSPEGDDVEKMDQQDIITNGHLPIGQSQPVEDILFKHRAELEPNHNEAKSRIAFLDIRHDNGGNVRSTSSTDHTPDKSPTAGAKPFVPPLDFTTLHENIGGQDPILAQKSQQGLYQHSGPPTLEEEHHSSDAFVPEDENEAPTAVKSNKVKRKAGTAMEEDDLPPFSRVEQDQYKLHSHGGTDDELTSKMKSQMRKIQGLKKKIKHFEEAFEKEHGYRPSHAEKASKPEIKKFLMELSRARKEAKRLKEEAEMGSRSRHGSGASSTGERVDPPDLPPSMAQTLDIILKRLKEKRKDTHRPEDIELMNSDQVQDEKLAVQKALLHFEGIHGRPKSKDEKDLMRPLYDRYRTIKRMLSRQPMSPRGNLELQTVPEDQPIDIKAQSKFNEPIQVEPIRVPTAYMDNGDDDDEPPGPLDTMQFAVTRDFAIIKHRPVAVEDQGPHSPKARRKINMQENIENRKMSDDSNLHELSAPELQDHLIKSRNMKKRLRKTLRDFEENFMTKTGRKVGRDDRVPMQAEYNEYKQLKARLKLLEALLSKHNHSEVLS